jgi:hypothetical protein
MYTRAGYKQPTAKDVAMAAGHQYETLLTNNSRKPIRPAQAERT